MATQGSPRFLDIEAARNFIKDAMSHYEERHSPTWFIGWLDDLYIRLGEDYRHVTLDEMATLSFLSEEGLWMTLDHAIPTAIKLFDRLGRPIPSYY
jgi:hypothetical protein